jgi:hypothetical protein
VIASQPSRAYLSEYTCLDVKRSIFAEEFLSSFGIMGRFSIGRLIHAILDIVIQKLAKPKPEYNECKDHYIAALIKAQSETSDSVYRHTVSEGLESTDAQNARKYHATATEILRRILGRLSSAEMDDCAVKRAHHGSDEKAVKYQYYVTLVETWLSDKGGCSFDKVMEVMGECETQFDGRGFDIMMLNAETERDYFTTAGTGKLAEILDAALKEGCGLDDSDKLDDQFAYMIGTYNTIEGSDFVDLKIPCKVIIDCATKAAHAAQYMTDDSENPGKDSENYKYFLLQHMLFGNCITSYILTEFLTSVTRTLVTSFVGQDSSCCCKALWALRKIVELLECPVSTAKKPVIGELPCPVECGVYPCHWGEPPEIQTADIQTADIQTADIKQLPAPYNNCEGSSTLYKWILEKLAEDEKCGEHSECKRLPNPRCKIQPKCGCDDEKIINGVRASARVNAREFICAINCKAGGCLLDTFFKTVLMNVMFQYGCEFLDNLMFISPHDADDSNHESAIVGDVYFTDCQSMGLRKHANDELTIDASKTNVVVTPIMLALDCGVCITAPVGVFADACVVECCAQHHDTEIQRHILTTSLDELKRTKKVYSKDSHRCSFGKTPRGPDECTTAVASTMVIAFKSCLHADILHSYAEAEASGAPSVPSACSATRCKDSISIGSSMDCKWCTGTPPTNTVYVCELPDSGNTHNDQLIILALQEAADNEKFRVTDCLRAPVPLFAVRKESPSGADAYLQRLYKEFGEFHVLKCLEVVASTTDKTHNHETLNRTTCVTMVYCGVLNATEPAVVCVQEATDPDVTLNHVRPCIGNECVKVGSTFERNDWFDTTTTTIVTMACYLHGHVQVVPNGNGTIKREMTLTFQLEAMIGGTVQTSTSHEYTYTYATGNVPILVNGMSNGVSMDHTLSQLFDNAHKALAVGKFKHGDKRKYVYGAMASAEPVDETTGLIRCSVHMKVEVDGGGGCDACRGESGKINVCLMACPTMKDEARERLGTVRPFNLGELPTDEARGLDPSLLSLQGIENGALNDPWNEKGSCYDHGTNAGAAQYTFRRRGCSFEYLDLYNQLTDGGQIDVRDDKSGSPDATNSRLQEESGITSCKLLFKHDHLTADHAKKQDEYNYQSAGHQYIVVTTWVRNQELPTPKQTSDPCPDCEVKYSIISLARPRIAAVAPTLEQCNQEHVSGAIVEISDQNGSVAPNSSCTTSAAKNSWDLVDIANSNSTKGMHSTIASSNSQSMNALLKSKSAEEWLTLAQQARDTAALNTNFSPEGDGVHWSTQMAKLMHTPGAQWYTGLNYDVVVDFVTWKYQPDTRWFPAKEPKSPCTPLPEGANSMTGLMSGMWIDKTALITVEPLTMSDKGIPIWAVVQNTKKMRPDWVYSLHDTNTTEVQALRIMGLDTAGRYVAITLALAGCDSRFNPSKVLDASPEFIKNVWRAASSIPVDSRKTFLHSDHELSQYDVEGGGSVIFSDADQQTTGGFWAGYSVHGGQHTLTRTLIHRLTSNDYTYAGWYSYHMLTPSDAIKVTNVQTVYIPTIIGKGVTTSAHAVPIDKVKDGLAYTDREYIVTELGPFFDQLAKNTNAYFIRADNAKTTSFTKPVITMTLPHAATLYMDLWGGETHLHRTLHYHQLIMDGWTLMTGVGDGVELGHESTANKSLIFMKRVPAGTVEIKGGGNPDRDNSNQDDDISGDGSDGIGNPLIFVVFDCEDKYDAAVDKLCVYDDNYVQNLCKAPTLTTAGFETVNDLAAWKQTEIDQGYRYVETRLNPHELDGWNSVNRVMIVQRRVSGTNWGHQQGWSQARPAQHPIGEYFVALQSKGSSISQTISGLVPGKEYILSFAATDSSPNPKQSGIEGVKEQVTTSITSGNSKLSLTSDTELHTFCNKTEGNGSCNWGVQNYKFEATQTEATIKFENTSTGEKEQLATGYLTMFIDIVNIKCVPTATNTVGQVTYKPTYSGETERFCRRTYAHNPEINTTITTDRLKKHKLTCCLLEQLQNGTEPPDELKINLSWGFSDDADRARALEFSSTNKLVSTVNVNALEWVDDATNSLTALTKSDPIRPMDTTCQLTVTPGTGFACKQPRLLDWCDGLPRDTMHTQDGLNTALAGMTLPEYPEVVGIPDTASVNYCLITITKTLEECNKNIIDLDTKAQKAFNENPCSEDFWENARAADVTLTCGAAAENVVKVPFGSQSLWDVAKPLFQQLNVIPAIGVCITNGDASSVQYIGPLYFQFDVQPKPGLRVGTKLPLPQDPLPVATWYSQACAKARSGKPHRDIDAGIHLDNEGNRPYVKFCPTDPLKSRPLCADLATGYHGETVVIDDVFDTPYTPPRSKWSISHSIGRRINESGTELPAMELGFGGKEGDTIDVSIGYIDGNCTSAYYGGDSNPRDFGLWKKPVVRGIGGPLGGTALVPEGGAYHRPVLFTLGVQTVTFEPIEANNQLAKRTDKIKACKLEIDTTDYFLPDPLFFQNYAKTVTPLLFTAESRTLSDDLQKMFEHSNLIVGYTDVVPAAHTSGDSGKENNASDWMDTNGVERDDTHVGCFHAALSGTMKDNIAAGMNLAGPNGVWTVSRVVAPPPLSADDAFEGAPVVVIVKRMRLMTTDAMGIPLTITVSMDGSDGRSVDISTTTGTTTHLSTVTVNSLSINDVTQVLQDKYNAITTDASVFAPGLLDGAFNAPVMLEVELGVAFDYKDLTNYFNSSRRYEVLQSGAFLAGGAFNPCAIVGMKDQLSIANAPQGDVKDMTIVRLRGKPLQLRWGDGQGPCGQGKAGSADMVDAHRSDAATQEFQRIYYGPNNDHSLAMGEKLGLITPVFGMVTQIITPDSSAWEKTHLSVGYQALPALPAQLSRTDDTDKCIEYSYRQYTASPPSASPPSAARLLHTTRDGTIATIARMDTNCVISESIEIPKGGIAAVLDNSLELSEFATAFNVNQLLPGALAQIAGANQAVVDIGLTAIWSHEMSDDTGLGGYLRAHSDGNNDITNPARPAMISVEPVGYGVRGRYRLKDETTSLYLSVAQDASKVAWLDDNSSGYDQSFFLESEQLTAVRDITDLDNWFREGLYNWWGHPPGMVVITRLAASSKDNPVYIVLQADGRMTITDDLDTASKVSLIGRMPFCETNRREVAICQKNEIQITAPSLCVASDGEIVKDCEINSVYLAGIANDLLSRISITGADGGSYSFKSTPGGGGLINGSGNPVDSLGETSPGIIVDILKNVKRTDDGSTVTSADYFSAQNNDWVTLDPTALASALAMTLIVDGNRFGGVPKFVELTAVRDITDLDNWNIKSAKNGNVESCCAWNLGYTKLTKLKAGQVIVIAGLPASLDILKSKYNTDQIFDAGNVMEVNGDDAIFLEYNGVITDMYGNVGEDGTGKDWEYTDTYVCRKKYAVASKTFVPDNWMINKVKLPVLEVEMMEELNNCKPPPLFLHIPVTESAKNAHNAVLAAITPTIQADIDAIVGGTLHYREFLARELGTGFEIVTWDLQRANILRSTGNTEVMERKELLSKGYYRADENGGFRFRRGISSQGTVDEQIRSSDLDLQLVPYHASKTVLVHSASSIEYITDAVAEMYACGPGVDPTLNNEDFKTAFTRFIGKGLCSQYEPDKMIVSVHPDEVDLRNALVKLDGILTMLTDTDVGVSAENLKNNNHTLAIVDKTNKINFLQKGVSFDRAKAFLEVENLDSKTYETNDDIVQLGPYMDQTRRGGFRLTSRDRVEIMVLRVEDDCEVANLGTIQFEELPDPVLQFPELADIAKDTGVIEEVDNAYVHKSDGPCPPTFSDNYLDSIRPVIKNLENAQVAITVERCTIGTFHAAVPNCRQMPWRDDGVTSSMSLGLRRGESLVYSDIELQGPEFCLRDGDEYSVRAEGNRSNCAGLIATLQKIPTILPSTELDQLRELLSEYSVLTGSLVAENGSIVAADCREDGITINAYVPCVMGKSDGDGTNADYPGVNFAEVIGAPDCHNEISDIQVFDAIKGSANSKRILMGATTTTLPPSSDAEVFMLNSDDFPSNDQLFERARFRWGVVMNAGGVLLANVNDPDKLADKKWLIQALEQSLQLETFNWHVLSELARVWNFGLTLDAQLPFTDIIALLWTPAEITLLERIYAAVNTLPPISSLASATAIGPDYGTKTLPDVHAALVVQANKRIRQLCKEFVAYSPDPSSFSLHAKQLLRYHAAHVETMDLEKTMATHIDTLIMSTNLEAGARGLFYTPQEVLDADDTLVSALSAIHFRNAFDKLTDFDPVGDALNRLSYRSNTELVDGVNGDDEKKLAEDAYTAYWTMLRAHAQIMVDEFIENQNGSLQFSRNRGYMSRSEYKGSADLLVPLAITLKDGRVGAVALDAAKRKLTSAVMTSNVLGAVVTENPKENLVMMGLTCTDDGALGSSSTFGDLRDIHDKIGKVDEMGGWMSEDILVKMPDAIGGVVTITADGFKSEKLGEGTGTLQIAKVQRTVHKSWIGGNPKDRANGLISNVLQLSDLVQGVCIRVNPDSLVTPAAKQAAAQAATDFRNRVAELYDGGKPVGVAIGPADRCAMVTKTYAPVPGEIRVDVPDSQGDKMDCTILHRVGHATTSSTSQRVGTVAAVTVPKLELACSTILRDGLSSGDHNQLAGVGAAGFELKERRETAVDRGPLRDDIERNINLAINAYNNGEESADATVLVMSATVLVMSATALRRKNGKVSFHCDALAQPPTPPWVAWECRVLAIQATELAEGSTQTSSWYRGNGSLNFNDYTSGEVGVIISGDPPSDELERDIQGWSVARGHSWSVGDSHAAGEKLPIVTSENSQKVGGAIVLLVSPKLAEIISKPTNERELALKAKIFEAMHCTNVAQIPFGQELSMSRVQSWREQFKTAGTSVPTYDDAETILAMCLAADSSGLGDILKNLDITLKSKVDAAQKEAFAKDRNIRDLFNAEHDEESPACAAITCWRLAIVGSVLKEAELDAKGRLDTLTDKHIVDLEKQKATLNEEASDATTAAVAAENAVWSAKLDRQLTQLKATQAGEYSAMVAALAGSDSGEVGAATSELAGMLKTLKTAIASLQNSNDAAIKSMMSVVMAFVKYEDGQFVPKELHSIEGLIITSKGLSDGNLGLQVDAGTPTISHPKPHSHIWSHNDDVRVGDISATTGVGKADITLINDGKTLGTVAEGGIVATSGNLRTRTVSLEGLSAMAKIIDAINGQEGMASVMYGMWQPSPGSGKK